MNSKKKGNRAERAVVHFWRDWTGLAFERTPMSGGLRWKKAENIAGDIVCTEPNFIFPYSIEVKAHRDINFSHLMYGVKSDILKWWDQAVKDAARVDKIPLLFMRYNGLPKNFYFVAFYLGVYREFKKQGNLIPSPWLVYQNKYQLFITTTDSLKEVPYKKFHKLGRKWQRDHLSG